MRHYVLEYGQSASRNAKLSNSLSDDDPRKEEVDCIIRKEFSKNISEKTGEIRSSLVAAGILDAG